MFRKTAVNHIRKRAENCQPKSGKDKKGDKETSGQGDIKVFAIVEKLMKQKDILYI